MVKQQYPEISTDVTVATKANHYLSREYLMANEILIGRNFFTSPSRLSLFGGDLLKHTFVGHSTHLHDEPTPSVRNRAKARQKPPTGSSMTIA